MKTGLGKALGRFAGAHLEEQGTETATGWGQGREEAEIGWRDHAPSIGEAFREQAPATFWQTLLIQGRHKAASKGATAYQKYRMQRDGALPEIESETQDSAESAMQDSAESVRSPEELEAEARIRGATSQQAGNAAEWFVRSELGRQLQAQGRSQEEIYKFAHDAAMQGRDLGEINEAAQRFYGTGQAQAQPVSVTDQMNSGQPVDLLSVPKPGAEIGRLREQGLPDEIIADATGVGQNQFELELELERLRGLGIPEDVIQDSMADIERNVVAGASRGIGDAIAPASAANGQANAASDMQDWIAQGYDPEDVAYYRGQDFTDEQIREFLPRRPMQAEGQAAQPQGLPAPAIRQGLPYLQEPPVSRQAMPMPRMQIQSGSPIAMGRQAAIQPVSQMPGQAQLTEIQQNPRADTQYQAEMLGLPAPRGVMGAMQALPQLPRVDGMRPAMPMPQGQLQSGSPIAMGQEAGQADMAASQRPDAGRFRPGSERNQTGRVVAASPFYGEPTQTAQAARESQETQATQAEQPGARREYGTVKAGGDDPTPEKYTIARLRFLG